MDIIKKSHIDLEKLDKVPQGQVFEYRDVVSDDFSEEEDRSIDGTKFKEEVKKGMYAGINIFGDVGTRLLYKKNK